MNSRLLFVTFLSVLITACGSSKQVASSASFTTSAYRQYKVDSNYKGDSTIINFLKPYAAEVNKQMNVVIGNTETPLQRKTPEGTLGNFVTDAMKQQASLFYKKNVDIAIVNDGGLRVSYIATGPIALGKIYELMPFDNLIVLIQLKGDQLLSLLDLIAAKNGWPVSGIQMQIVKNKATNIKVNGRAIDVGSDYTIATTDYTANGNEGFEMLKQFKQENNGYLLRDALIDYIKENDKQGKRIHVKIENRITNVK